MMRRLFGVVVVVLALASVIALPVANAGGDSSPQAQFRTFSCDDGNTYTGGYVSPVSGEFFLVDSTSVFAFKIYTIYNLDGTVQTFNYGYRGFDSSTLITCSYIDPDGDLDVFSGWITPRS